MRTSLLVVAALVAAPLSSGCQLLVSFDRNRIVADAGVDAPGTMDAPATDAPETDAPVLDAPVLDAPALDDVPAIDAPLEDAPGTDAPTLDVGTDAPVTSDAGADAPEPVDAGADAPACTPSCSGTTPICDPSDFTCVECVVVGDCTGAGGCVGRTCVECDANADCTSPTASACDANACEACDADADCTHLSGTPVCDEPAGTCVACTADTEAARCGANSCNTTTHTCTTTPRASVDPCETCAADSECTTGARCVATTFGGTATGTRCLFDAALGCGDTVAARRPYTTTGAGTSLGGVAATYCRPPATTSCPGILDLDTDRTCTMDTDCGVTGQADGHCLAGGTCSYTCAAAAECPGSLACDGTSMLCDGP